MPKQFQALFLQKLNKFLINELKLLPKTARKVSKFRYFYAFIIYFTMSQKRLFLLDAYALIFRGYFAFIKNPRINSKGMDTSAIMGFMNALMDVIKREKPDHLAVAFDNGGSNLRNEIVEEREPGRQRGVGTGHRPRA